MKKTLGALVSLMLISASFLSPAHAKSTRAPASDDVPLFRHVLDCNVALNPILSYVGVGTLTTAKFDGESHVADLVPAPPLTPRGRAGFYVLSDHNQAVFIDAPVQANEPMQWEESGPFSKKASAVTKDRIYSDEDTLNGRFEVAVNLACSANFAFKDPEGHPVRKLVDSDGNVFVGGVAITGTCSNMPVSQGVTEIPMERKLAKGKIDRAVAGPEVDKAAIDDLHIRLSEAMARVIENVRAPERLKASYPEVHWAGNIGTKGAEQRKNACHLLTTFFKLYNECASQSLGGAGGLGEISQRDPDFHQRLSTLGELYASFREPSDTAECKPPVEGAAAEQGGLNSGAAR